MSERKDIIWAETLAAAKPGEYVRFFQGGTGSEQPVVVTKVGPKLITVLVHGMGRKFRIENGYDAAHTSRSPGMPSWVVDNKTYEVDQLKLRLYGRLLAFGLRLEPPRATVKVTTEELVEVANFLSWRHGLEPL